MSNMRLYEFARQLSMDSDALLKRLRAGGLDLPNTMVILDEATIKKAREIISSSGVGKSLHVEETRVNPGVIRRRKVKSEETQIPHSAPEQMPKEEEERVVEMAKHRQETAAHPMETEIVSEVVVEMKEPETSPEPPFVEEEKSEPTPLEEEPENKETRLEKKKPKHKHFKHKKKPKKKFEEPAKIIKRPEEIVQPEVGQPVVVQSEVVQPEGVQPEVGQPVAKPPEPGAPKAVAPAIQEEPMEEGVEELAPGEEMEDSGADTSLEEKLPEGIEEIFPVEGIPIGEPLRPQKKKKEKKREAFEERESIKTLKKIKKMEIYEREELYEGKLRAKKEKKKEKKPAPAVPLRVVKPQEEVKPEPKPTKKKVKMEQSIILGDLAKAMGVKASELIKKLLELGTLATINQALDYETAALLADEYGCEIEQVVFKEEDLLQEVPDKEEDLRPRPPVVTVMGHVDHGKTTLLDYIRKSKVAEAESGGITQHIGAYYVKTDGGGVVFLDTPGHEAFTAMRARGAKVTDIIVLVVAADDGVMPQTKEAINHAKAANIPIVVAINKIDKPNANPERVKRQLADLGLIPEEWGGDVIFGNISAKTGMGVDELLGLILLQAEVMELKANPNKRAKGFIIEARLDKTRGPVATVLVKEGTLNVGDYVVTGGIYGKVRAMFDHKGSRMKSAGPSIPVEIYGLQEVPNAGDEIVVVPDERTAKTIVEHRRLKEKQRDLSPSKPVSMEDFFERIKEGQAKELNVVLKTDVQGSLEAISDALGKVTKGDIKVQIIHAATGAITESDVMLASASNALILGFNVRANPRVKEVAEKEKVQIRYYDVIYNLLEDVEKALSGMLEPVYEEKTLGEAEVLQTFKIPKIGVVAGCIVRNGIVRRNAKVRVIRDGVVVHEGGIASLKRFKEDAKEVQEGMECGIGLERFQDLKPGDIIEVFALEEVSQ